MIFIGNLMEHNKNAGRTWDFASMASIIIMVIGVVTAVYSTHSVLTLRQHFTYSLNVSGSGQKINPAGANFVRRGLFDSPDMIIVGVLLLLFGFVSFKYANLKMHSS